MTNPRGPSGSGEGKRFFVGNLFPDVGGDDLAKLFGRFGSVASEIKNKTDIDGKVVSTFAFVTVTGGAEASDVIREYNGLKWKKHSIKVQVAQESFMQRLARERQEKVKNFSTENDPSYDPMAMMKGRSDGGEGAVREVQAPVAEEEPKLARNAAESGDDVDDNDHEEEVRLTKKRRFDPMAREKFAYETKWKFDKRKDTNYELPTTSEPTGTARGGVINFDDDDGDVPSGGEGQSRPVYHSSSEEEETRGSKQSFRKLLVPTAKPQSNASKKFEDSRPIRTSASKPQKFDESRPMRTSASKPQTSASKPQRRRYYSSSDSETEHESREVKGTRPPNVMSKLESFDSGFWRDPGEEDRKEISRQRYNESDPSYDAMAMMKGRNDDNKKRMDAMRKRQKELKGSGVKLEVDGSGGSAANKKIRFEKGDTEGVKNAKNDLFADSDDDDDDNEDDNADTFKIRPQFEGKKGHRLLELQSRFGGGDNRFKIDDRFGEGDDARGGDDESGDADGDLDGEGELDAEGEKKRNLKILQSLTRMAEPSGGDLKRKSAPSSYFMDSSKMRFDPSKEEEMKLKTNEDDSSKKDIEESNAFASSAQKETPMPEVGSDKSYWLKEDIFSKGAGTEKASTGSAFSFGFGNQSSGSGPSLLEKQEYRAETLQPAKKKSALSFLERNPFKYDSSSEDEAESGEKKDKRKTKKVVDMLKAGDEGGIGDFALKLAEKTAAVAGLKSVAAAAAEPFFFTGVDDARFREGVEFLRPTETMEELRTRFETQRPVLANILKKKLRARAKRQEKMSFGSRAGGLQKKRKTFGTGKEKGKRKKRSNQE